MTGESTADRRPSTEEEIQAARIGGATPYAERVVLAEYDPQWPELFRREEERIRGALGDTVVMLEHVGSTSVPGLAAKPRIDILLVVPNSADEAAYVPALEAAGYYLRVREPDWHEHRVLKGPDTALNLHVFSPGSPEVDRMLSFRDWLRENEEDRLLYERTKRELAQRDWKYVQNYADAKTEVVEEIIARALAARGAGTEERSIVAVRVLCVSEGRLLLVRERHKVYGHEFWSVPGGALELGETPEEGARREFFEETGLQVDELIPAPPRLPEEAVFIGRVSAHGVSESAAPDPAGEVLGAEWCPITTENPLGPLHAEYWGLLSATIRGLLERASTVSQEQYQEESSI